jgi:hypothetical protein
MTHTISTSYASLVSLTGPADDPTTINSSATLSGGLGAAAYGVDWTITNAGQIFGIGLYLFSSGTVANTATITGTGNFGVYVRGNGNVSNASGGTIIGANNGVDFTGTGTVSNSGGIRGAGFAGVVFVGGYVSNASGGTISGYDAGIKFFGAQGSVVNAGDIMATASYMGPGDVYGVFLSQGGSLTNVSGATISAANYGVKANNGPATVTNAGTISSADDGVYLNADGTVINTSGGLITGANHAVYLDGLVEVVTNAAGGTISQGNGGVYAFGGVGTVYNAGFIEANINAVYLRQGGSATNAAGGTITAGSYGILVASAAGTVINAGLISGGMDAVKFAAGFANQLTVDPGAAFSGTVDGGNLVGAGIVSILELTSAASAGTLSGLGSQYIDFGQITIDSGASWTLTGTNGLAAGGTITNAGTLALSAGSLVDAGALVNNGVILLGSSPMVAGPLTGTGSVTIGVGGLFETTGTVALTEIVSFATSSGAFYLTPGAGANFAGQIDGFSTGATIALTGVSDATAINVVNTNTLAVTSTSLGTIDLTLDPAEILTGATFFVVDQGGNAVITADGLACFVSGTYIATESGETRVEALKPGDLLPTKFAGVVPVKWIGHRHINCSRHRDPRKVWPVRVRAGAFAPGANGESLPGRDLWLSPDHAVFVNDVLIPVRHLINGITIEQVPRDRVTYYHIELDHHDIVLAEGLPAESYLDTGDRLKFANGGGLVTLHPEFSVRVWEALGCAPLIVTGHELETTRRRLARRARRVCWKARAETVADRMGTESDRRLPAVLPRRAG